MEGITCPACGEINEPQRAYCKLCGAPLTSTSPHLPVGTKLNGGRYTVGKLLGRGGFAITYQGGDTTLTRPVAIKELFPQGCTRQGTTVKPNQTLIAEFIHIKEKFLEEARLLAKLKHNAIVEVYDFFEENNTAYMVMELLRGKTLKDLISQKGKLEEKDAIKYIMPICDALKLVHKEGFLHRDIKPDNIFITNDGRVVLIDFGAAREFAAGRTQSQTVILTPGYAPNSNTRRGWKGDHIQTYTLYLPRSITP